MDAGLRTKKCIVDMACGQGKLACWMARQVAGSGIVIGIDIKGTACDS